MRTFVATDFGGDERRFQLKLGQIRELQEICKTGIGAIYERVATGGFYVDDIRETVRLGLIGGGMSPAEALRLTRAYVDEQPLFENRLLAMAILSAITVGLPDSDEGKAPAATDGSTSPPVTASEPLSDGIPEPSTL
jgi:hypothetical protein